MEWTDAAQREMERIQEQIRTSLNPDEVDPAEVVDDIQSRIKEELNQLQLHTVTAENVQSAARKIGIQDIIIEAPPAADEHKERFDRAVERPRRVRENFSIGWFWFTGIILPLIALLVELFTRMCMEAGLPDPLPTPFHALLIALIPITCILGRRFNKDEKTIRIELLGLLLGGSLTVSIFYTMLFITITPFAIAGFAAIIYFGVGLLAFLPLSPLLSTITLIALNKWVKQKLGTKIPRFKTGMILGLLALLITSMPVYITKLGLRLAASENPTTQIKGITLLRTVGDKALMNRACYQSINAPDDPITWVITMGRTSPEDARSIYYRVTGRAFNTMASPTLGFRTRRNPGDEFDWDPEQGGDVVAGRLKGLSLSESRMDGIVNDDAATAYIEWTMVFKNNWMISEREARAQIALPPGGVVSRLTLWIDGEEREAAFGGRSQVKQAYKQVVQRRRDPVLVTTCGPDRVLMQCFPVPANGEMKVRIGITAPLACLTLEDRRLKLPHLLERNFRIPENVNHAVWIEDHLTADLSDTELNAPGAQIKAQSAVKSCWINNGDATIRQMIQPAHESKPQQVAIVLDTSLGMKDQFDQIADAVNALPNDINLSIWIVSDGEPYQIERTEIKKLKAGGGKNNAPALRKALMESSECIVWVHASQEWDLGANEGVRQLLERSSDKQILEIQVNDGPNRLIEKLDTLNGFHSIPRYGCFKEDLERTLKSFSADYTVWETVRGVVQDQDGFHADDHLIRLWANDKINRILSDNNPDNREAIELATEHHLVTPISGAVVLESQEQYEENDLQPVDVANVPSIPEPGTLILLIFALLLLFYGRRIRAHFRTA
ncbi:MAG: PEP-CTERM sorting domain-containing protein [Pontiellaceae bacterium]|nr:PEP-CTERM sorting domain-containing protein [Pontiellaceae bacterium]